VKNSCLNVQVGKYLDYFQQQGDRIELVFKAAFSKFNNKVTEQFSF
jgi:hypothetical protein